MMILRGWNMQQFCIKPNGVFVTNFCLDYFTWLLYSWFLPRMDLRQGGVMRLKLTRCSKYRETSLTGSKLFVDMHLWCVLRHFENLIVPSFLLYYHINICCYEHRLVFPFPFLFYFYFLYLCVCVCVCVYICMYMHVCIYICECNGAMFAPCPVEMCNIKSSCVLHSVAL